MTATPYGELAGLLPVLRGLKIPHALIGGWAVIAWGFVRASDDLDLMADIPSPRRKALLDALAKDYEAEWIAGDFDDPVRGMIRAMPRR